MTGSSINSNVQIKNGLRKKASPGTLMVSRSFHNGTILTFSAVRSHTVFMPRTRMDELYALAEEHDGLLTSKEARALGFGIPCLFG